jgi:protein-disulfide isomerase
MKYAQLVIGLLVGTALGGSVIAATGAAPGVSTGGDNESIKAIVRDVIAQEPQLILDSVQKYQIAEQQKKASRANDALKDSAVRDQVFNNADAPNHGQKDSKRVIVEFFDYNCGVCKQMFKGLETLAKKDPTLRVVFFEFPIFGETSDTNSKIALAVNRLYPEKYFDFHAKMMTNPARGTDAKVALGFAKALGMDADKVKAESEKKEVADILVANRLLGEKLHVQGTPLLIIGDEIIPHAMSPEDLEARVNAIK